MNNYTPLLPNKILYNTTILSDVGYVFTHFLTANIPHNSQNLPM
jgi:hypothetical protein